MARIRDWFERLIRIRKEAPEVGWGQHTVLDTGADGVLAMLHRWNDRCTLTVHNVADEATSVEIAVDERWNGMREVMSGSDRIAVEGGSMTLDIDAYGYRWLRPEELRTGRGRLS